MADPLARARTRLRQADPVMREIIKQVGILPPVEPGRDPFMALSRCIAGQQLSTAAARTIWGRVSALVRRWTPGAVARLDEERLRGCGLSARKASYIRGLAEGLRSKRLRLDDLDRLDDEALRERLLGIKGIGTWSVEMMMMFTVGRPDVFSPGDAGLRRAIVTAYAIDADDYEQHWPVISEAWKPQRTLACRYLWAWVDGQAVD